MRRVGFITFASILVFALAPASALARHHGRHHSRHRAHVKRFGTPSPTGPTAGPGATGTTNPGPSAGTVQSYDSTTGVLTIALNGGSTVSGTVTPQTEIECDAPEANETTAGGGEDGDPGASSGGEPGEEMGGGQQQSCSTANLTPGTVVQEAELRISSAGAMWQKVELQVQGAA